MKAVRVMFDEELLAPLDADQGVRREGRSAILRRTVAEYLERRRRQEIAERYRQAYRDGRTPPCAPNLTRSEVPR